jgi:hypothetical protein
LSIPPPIIHDYPVPFFNKRRIDILPHLGATKAMMEQYDGVTIAMHLVIYLEPLDICKRHA